MQYVSIVGVSFCVAQLIYGTLCIPCGAPRIGLDVSCVPSAKRECHSFMAFCILYRLLRRVDWMFHVL